MLEVINCIEVHFEVFSQQLICHLSLPSFLCLLIKCVNCVIAYKCK